MATQTVNGKAFEYALLHEFYVRLTPQLKVNIQVNEPYKTALKYFNIFNPEEQDAYRKSAHAAADFLIGMEPRISNSVNPKDVLVLEIVSDAKGQTGDVRDVLLIRNEQKWEIGISAKNNHKAVKHSRLSSKINFGKKWLGIECSPTYFAEINPVFEMLARLRKADKTSEWASIPDMHGTVYVPILAAFRKELLRLDMDNPGIVANKLVEYLIGNVDFYKTIKGPNTVEIQGYNINGSLSKSFENVKPSTRLQKLKLPSRVIEIISHKDSLTTLMVSLDEGWQISFRIHSAKSTIEPSLKFDINLVSTPASLFSHHIPVDHG